MSNLQLHTLLPLLLSEDPDAVAAKLETLSSSGITTANDILFPPSNVSQTAETLITSLHPRILGFLAAEGSPASTLYRPNIPFTASTGNKAIDALFPNRDLAFMPSEIVEIVGNHGSGRTHLMLQTVLRSLQKDKKSYALWLDTEGKFKAEDAASILLAMEGEIQTLSPISGQPEGAGLESDGNGAKVDDRPEISERSLSALDRLIVSKAFDLQAAIRAIQEVRRDGFPSAQAEAEPKVEHDIEGVQDGQPPEAGIDGNDNAAGGIDGSEAETTRQDADVNNEGEISDKAAASVQVAPTGIVPAVHQASQETDDQAQSSKMHLRFIVIDSITPLLSKLFSRESAEGHAKMMTFMRLLRSLVTSLPCIVLLSNGLTPASAASGNNLSVFASETTQTVKPSLGPSFTYLCDITLALHTLQDVFPREAEPGRIVEIWRHRNGPAKRWAVARSDGVRWLQ